MTERTIEVMCPVPAGGARPRALTPRPEGLAGRRVGFLDNRKHNADRLFRRLGALMQERYGVATVVHRQKATSSVPATAALLAELAQSCDLVVAGSGD